jgi:hypothetical protein
MLHIMIEYKRGALARLHIHTKQLVVAVGRVEFRLR